MSLNDIGLQKLLQEPQRLKSEADRVNTELEGLVIENYRVFVENLTVSMHLQSEEKRLKDLSKGLEDNISSLSHACGAFKERVQEVVSAHKRNRKTLQCHLQLLELLEIPQLVESCARNGFVDEAIELASFVNGLERRHLLAMEVKGGKSGSQGVIQSIVADVQRSLITLRESLLTQLADIATLPKQITVVGALRKLDSLLAERCLSLRPKTEKQFFLTRLETKRLLDYLEARTLWMHKARCSMSAGIGAYGKAVELIEGKRISLHSILSHTFALFLPSSTATAQESAMFTVILRAWATHQISSFCVELKTLLLQVEDGSALRALLEQSLFLAARLAHPTIGLDITAILLSLFETVLTSKLQTELSLAESQLVTALALEKVTMMVPPDGAGEKGQGQGQVLVVPLFNTTTTTTTTTTLLENGNNHRLLPEHEDTHSADDLRAPTQLLRLPPLCLAMNTILAALSFVRGCPLGSTYSACKATVILALTKMVVHVVEQAHGIRTRGAKFLGDGFLSNGTNSSSSSSAGNERSGRKAALGGTEEKADILYAFVLAKDFLPHVLLSLDAVFGRVAAEQLRYYEAQRRASENKSNAHVVMNRKQAEAMLGRDLAVDLVRLWRPLLDHGLLVDAEEEAAKEAAKAEAEVVVPQPQAVNTTRTDATTAATELEKENELVV